MESPTFPFFKLPLEIRQAVYSSCLKEPDPWIFLSILGKKEKSPLLGKLYPAVLQINCQMGSEVLDHYYSTTAIPCLDSRDVGIIVKPNYSKLVEALVSVELTVLHFSKVFSTGKLEFVMPPDQLHNFNAFLEICTTRGKLKQLCLSFYMQEYMLPDDEVVDVKELKIERELELPSCRMFALSMEDHTDQSSKALRNMRKVIRKMYTVSGGIEEETT